RVSACRTGDKPSPSSAAVPRSVSRAPGLSLQVRTRSRSVRYAVSDNGRPGVVAGLIAMGAPSLTLGRPGAGGGTLAHRHWAGLDCCHVKTVPVIGPRPV